MKKYLTLLIAAFTITLSAQDFEFQLSSFYYFLPNQSQYYSNPIDRNITRQQLEYKEKPGIALSAFYKLTLINKNDFSIGLGVNWHSYNLKYFERNVEQGDINPLITNNSFVVETGAINPTCAANLVWLNIPAVYHYEIIDNLNIDGGVQLSALLYNNQDYKYYTQKDNAFAINNKDYQKGLSKYMASLILGGEYRIIKELSVSLHYHFSLTSLYEKEYRYIDNSRLQGISLGVKYHLSL